MAVSKFSKSSAAFPPSVQEKPSPLSSFVSMVMKIKKVDGPDVDKSEWIKSEFLLDQDNPASYSKYPRQFVIFKDG
jgi:hypothetical protein